MNGSEFKTELKKGLSGGYLLCGPEAYLRKHYLKEIRKKVVDYPGDVFNHIILSGSNFNIDALLASIQSLPVFSEKKLIEISDVSFSEMNADELENFLNALSVLPEYEYNILAIDAEISELDPGTDKKPTKLLKELSKFVKPVIFERETPQRLAKWAQQHFSSRGVFVSGDAALRIVQYCGGDMFMLSGEIDKLASYTLAKGRDKLDEKDVPKIASRMSEIQSFDLANAILEGNCELSYSIIYELKMKKEKPELILAGISRVICDLAAVKALSDSGVSCREAAQKLKMHEYKASLYYKSAAKCSSEALDRAIELCHNADMRIKNSNLDCYTVLDGLAAGVSVRR